MPLAFITNLKFILAAVLGLALLALWIQSERLASSKKDLETERRNAAQWEQNANDAATLATNNAAALDQYKADVDRANAAADAARAKTEAMNRDLSKLKKEIHNASADQDGPVAIVLRVTLDRLRRISPDGANDNPGETGGARTDSGRVAIVRTGPGSSGR